eukprot:s448_g21.t1
MDPSERNRLFSADSREPHMDKLQIAARRVAMLAPFRAGALAALAALAARARLSLSVVKRPSSDDEIMIPYSATDGVVKCTIETVEKRKN